MTLSEDAAASTITPIATFEAVDADAGTNSQINYTLEGDPDDRFDIDDVNGDLFLKGTLDFEVQKMFNLLIVATDKGTLSLMYYCTIIGESLFVWDFKLFELQLFFEKCKFQSSFSNH